METWPIDTVDLKKPSQESQRDTKEYIPAASLAEHSLLPGASATAVCSSLSLPRYRFSSGERLSEKVSRGSRHRQSPRLPHSALMYMLLACFSLHRLVPITRKTTRKRGREREGEFRANNRPAYAKGEIRRWREMRGMLRLRDRKSDLVECKKYFVQE